MISQSTSLVDLVIYIHTLIRLSENLPLVQIFEISLIVNASARSSCGPS